MAYSIYSIEDLSYKRSVLVPFYYFVNTINYECENIWSLLSTGLTQTSGRKTRRYFQEQIPVQNSGSSIEVKD